MNILKKYEMVLMTPEEPLRTALLKLCTSGKRVLFLVEETKFLASLNDGDIRRFLLKGGSLDAPAKEAANFHARFLFDTEREKAKQFLWENNINAVPIVDEDKNILDIVFLHDVVEINEAKIRILKHDDLGMVLEFFDQMAGDTRAMFNRGDVNRVRVMEHLSRRKDDNEVHFAATVTDEDGHEKMVGYVFLWDLDTLIPWLGICVREDWKGNHLGRKLLEYLDSYLQPKGYGGVMLTSVPANIRAHALYERMGFVYYGNHPSSEFLYIKRYPVKKDL